MKQASRHIAPAATPTGRRKKFQLLVLLFATGLLLAIAVNAQDDVLFRAVTNDTLNLRACGSTDCARVG